MMVSNLDVLVLTHSERVNRFKDKVISRKYEQASLVLVNESINGREKVIVLKDKFGLFKNISPHAVD